MAELAGFAPTLPGVTKSESPMAGKDLISTLVGKMSGKQPGPRMSAGDKVAQAVQLLREAAQEDLRIAPLVNGAIQSLVTGGPSNAGPGNTPPGPVQGPTPQAAAGGGGPMAAIASMLSGGA